MLDLANTKFKTKLSICLVPFGQCAVMYRTLNFKNYANKYFRRNRWLRR